MKRHFQEKTMMASKRLTKGHRPLAPKGRGGQSGGVNPRNSREISEDQHEEAMRILRVEYFNGVRGITQELKEAVASGEITSNDDLEERLHQNVDGSYWIIYTHANFQVLMCSDHHDAYSEEFGEPPVEGDTIKWAALAFAAMERDVRAQMDAEGVQVVEETSHRHKMHTAVHAPLRGDRRPPRRR